MRLFVPDEPDTVENNIQYRALGRSFYRCLREFDLADLHSQVHDEAVDLLEDILMVLDDPDLDDAHCLDEIVLLYQFCVSLFFVQFEDGHKCFGGKLYAAQRAHFLFVYPTKAALLREP